MRVKKYKKLYSVSADEFDLLDDNTKNFWIFQGSKNWDFYFDNKLGLKNYSHLRNINFLDFGSKKAFESYLSSNIIIDYSLEHSYESNQYFALVADSDCVKN